jgi:hypothetical protein
MSNLTGITEIVKEYRQAAIGASVLTPKKQNEWADKVHKCYKILCQSEMGRQAIVRSVAEGPRVLAAWRRRLSNSASGEDVSRCAGEGTRHGGGGIWRRTVDAAMRKVQTPSQATHHSIRTPTQRF